MFERRPNRALSMIKSMDQENAIVDLRNVNNERFLVT